MVICLWLHEGRTSVVPTSNGKPTVDEISILLDYMLTKISIYFPYFRGRNWWARIHQSLVEEKPRQDHRCECSGGGHVVTPGNPSGYCEWGLYRIVGLEWEKCHSRGKIVRKDLQLFNSFLEQLWTPSYFWSFDTILWVVKWCKKLMARNGIRRELLACQNGPSQLHTRHTTNMWSVIFKKYRTKKTGHLIGVRLKLSNLHISY